MKSEAQLLSEHNGKCQAQEAEYIETQRAIQYSLQKTLQIQAAIGSYRMKLHKAHAEFEMELETINQNYKSIPGEVSGTG